MVFKKEKKKNPLKTFNSISHLYNDIVLIFFIIVVELKHRSNIIGTEEEKDVVLEIKKKIIASVIPNIRLCHRIERYTSIHTYTMGGGDLNVPKGNVMIEGV